MEFSPSMYSPSGGSARLISARQIEAALERVPVKECPLLIPQGLQDYDVIQVSRREHRSKIRQLVGQA